ncbi:MAG: sigma-70 family RNA polymerase sigma factor [Archangium sp.]|nr:sigma-70 family RNA polymerase sigma factor [Archangium sp.]
MSPELVRRAQSGDREALATLFAQLGPLLAALVRRLGLPGERADQLQAVSAHLVEVLGRFDPSGSAKFSTWATTVATRFLLMELRKKRPEFVTLDEQPSTLADPASVAEGRSLGAALDRALEALPLAQRRAFVLASMEGLPLDELAALEEVPVGTIKSRLARARMALVLTMGPLLDRSTKGGAP